MSSGDVVIPKKLQACLKAGNPTNENERQMPRWFPNILPMKEHITKGLLKLLKNCISKRLTQLLLVT